LSDVFRTLENKKLTAIDGPNFSGRTYLLRLMTGLETDVEGRYPQSNTQGQGAAYIGPEIYNAISGLAPTVEEELNIHMAGSRNKEELEKMNEILGLSDLKQRNPVTLSGGEQAMLTLSCALGLSPGCLAIDSAFEQVSTENRKQLTSRIMKGAFPDTSFFLADNRLSEYPEIQETVPISDQIHTPDDQRLLSIAPLNAEIDLPLSLQDTASLTLDHLDFQYPHGPHVIKNLNLTLEPGRLYTLTGKNGAGKSTLAKLLCGVLQPDQGHIRLNQEIYDAWSHPGRQVGYHFQNPDLQLFSTQIEDEIAAGPGAQQVEARQIEGRTEALMNAFGLSGLKEAHPLEMPFVLRKRIALAATMAMGCPWLILDEPTLGQDHTSALALKSMIDQMSSKGFGIVVISHSEWFCSLLDAEEIKLGDG